MHVKLFVLQKIAEDQDQRFPVHPVGDQDPDWIEDLPADDPGKEIIFVLKMIIKSHTDDACSVRDLFDRNLLKRHFRHKPFQAHGKLCFNVPLFFQTKDLLPSVSNLCLQCGNNTS